VRLSGRDELMQGDRRRLELAYSLMMTLPGTPVFRYGDEIAMGDNLDLPERDCARTPMQWSDELQAGFTKSDKPVIPVVAEGPYGFEHVSVAAQMREPNSLMDWTERMIRMRKEVPEIGWGDFSHFYCRSIDKRGHYQSRATGVGRACPRYHSSGRGR
jgi:maltose alpha-D-glucosyltransferase/alpha-amylase